MTRPAQHSVTIVDVAKAAGVSKSTAGRALTGADEVSTRTREKVARVAAELGYRPNGVARSMITGNTETVGVVIPDMSNRFFSAALQSIARTVRQHGYELLVSSTEGEPTLERRSVEVLATKRVDGLIVAPVGGADAHHLRQLAESGTALVLLDRPAPKITGASFVSVNNIEASRLAVNHLIGLGHRHIGIISEAWYDAASAGDAEPAPTVDRPSTLRLAGYVRAMTDAGLTVRSEHVAHSAYSSTASYAATRKLLQATPRVTAIYCTDNVLSVGAFAALQDSGRRCPQEVSLIGFDDHEWAPLVRPRLTVVAQPTEVIGATAAEDLLAAIADPTREPATRLLPARLVTRDSTAPPDHLG
ncbi:LacI family DNA-binding transcriptional regulator [Streptomyces sp. NEAU-YJ-81]|uniref:LacI family DNA-binding transcriptional regulator n=1 Tax=Streptomyces sp. NEAU-YJ-81 TaxID=2820288 RepID=UPI001ABBEFB3|nr:LacI family DNA-binding transcriptional regulator [Streptomyces sp. NEAU-YJ-81]MBO3681942.1 LacI family DNA-binding transcriptional regulator [Streptomyces sp. NEAU-YJ-81]